MKYTVAICTWNRVGVLNGAIQSVAGQANAPDFEILVVDNGSNDGTSALVLGLANDIPRLRIAHEPRLGIAHARNRALREARGEVVAFLDDDARACTTWLTAIDAAFAQVPAAACVGGPVRLLWPMQPPSWMPLTGLLFLGELDLGAKVRKLRVHERPRGMNMSVRREVALAIGGFKGSLGHRGGSLLSGEEDEFLSRMYRANLEVWWAPDATVEHLVHPDRITGRWLLRRAWMQGRSEVIEAMETTTPTPTHLAMDAAADTVAAAALSMYSTILLGFDRRRSCNRALQLVYSAGRAYEEGQRLLSRRRRVSRP